MKQAKQGPKSAQPRVSPNTAVAKQQLPQRNTPKEAVSNAPPKENKRRDTKRKIISIQTLLRAKEIKPEQRAEMERKIVDLRRRLQELAPEFDRNELLRRRDFLYSNPGLRDIFRALWLVFFGFTEDGYLSREGYGKFNHAIAIALLGASPNEDLTASIEADWLHDKAV